MPNPQYVKGRAYEYKIKHQLEDQGFTVVRSAGSHSLFDLVAVHPIDRIIKLIQCKTGKTKQKMIAGIDANITDFEGVYSVGVDIV